MPLPWPRHIAILAAIHRRVRDRLARRPCWSDIFREVDEEFRRERLEQLWTRHRFTLIALAIVAVAGVGGWRGYQWWEAKKAAEAGAQFEAAVSLAAQGKYDEAVSGFGELRAAGTPGHP